MDAYHLSQRLQTVAADVFQGAFLADIGSDHAYLPANLALKHLISRAIAGEVALGPYQNAATEIQKLKLTEQIKVRHADGLAALNNDEIVDVITICGMGGALIAQILTTGWSKLQHFSRLPRLILQPNVGEKIVRSWLQQHNYQITAEKILKEDGHIYEIITADPAVGQVQPLNQEQLLFGPILLSEKNAVFQEKWQLEVAKLQKVWQQLRRAKKEPVAKKQQIKHQIKMIEGIINDKS